MTFSVSSGDSDTASAILHIAEAVRERPPGDAALVFVSRHHAPSQTSEALRDVLPMPFVCFFGTSAFDGLLRDEDTPSIVALVFSCDYAEARTAGHFALGALIAAELAAEQHLGSARFLSASENAGSEQILAALDEQKVAITGALSAADKTELLSVDGLRILNVVCQGTRPFSIVRMANRSQDLALLELDGRPALEMLLQDLPAHMQNDLSRLRGILLLGVLRGDSDVYYQEVTGVDPTLQALGTKRPVAEGQRVVFGRASATSARAEVEERLQTLADVLAGEEIVATLVFTHQKRDASYMGTPLYDVGRVVDLFGHHGPVVGVSSAAPITNQGDETCVYGNACVVSVLVRER